MLLCSAGFGQAGVTGPPVCPGIKAVIEKDLPRKDIRPVEKIRPSVESARSTAETEAADASVMVAAEPLENFGVARYRLQAYGDCVGNGGCYWQDLDAQLKRGEMAFAAELARQKKGDKLALVLDIDETTLSSYCEMKREDFGYIAEMFNTWVVRPEAAVGIAGTLRIYRAARAAGVAVFFLTGRPEEQRAGTERNLRAVGYDGWAGVLLRDAAEKEMPTVTYKSGERAKIVARGYTLVMSVGDQWSDLMGEPKAALSVKLPNPFYYLP